MRERSESLVGLSFLSRRCRHIFGMFRPPEWWGCELQPWAPDEHGVEVVTIAMLQKTTYTVFVRNYALDQPTELAGASAGATTLAEATHELGPPPGYGEHTREVLRRYGGLQEEQVEAMIAEGAAVQG